MRLPYSLLLIGRERGRYLPAILAVAFCAQLNILQWGMLLGTLSVLSMPIDRSPGRCVGSFPRCAQSGTGPSHSR